MSIATVMSMGFGSYGRVALLLRDGFASYTGLVDPPANGYQYQSCTSPITTDYSMAQSASPAVATGDVFITSLLTDPSLYGITLHADGTADIGSAFDQGRQSFTYNVYRSSSNLVDGPQTVWVNEVAPIWNNSVIVNNFVKNTPITSIDLASLEYTSSPSGDALTFSIVSGRLPDGLALSSLGVISGTPTANGVFSPVVFRATDNSGSYRDAPDSSFFVASASGTDDELQDLLDPGEDLHGVWITSRKDCPPVTSYYCQPIDIYPGRAKWIDVTTTWTNAQKVQAILDALKVPV